MIRSDSDIEGAQQGAGNPAFRRCLLAYYTGATLICAWCELRNDVRHFRTDRVVSADVLDESFSIPKTVIAKWLTEHQDD